MVPCGTLAAYQLSRTQNGHLGNEHWVQCLGGGEKCQLKFATDITGATIKGWQTGKCMASFTLNVFSDKRILIFKK